MPNSIISKNKVSLRGGIYIYSNRTVNITKNSYITDNAVIANGGGIYVVRRGTLNITS